MPQQQGSTSILVYDTESTYATDPGTPDVRVLPFSSEGLGLNTNIVSSETINNTRNRSKNFRGNKSVEGDITTELNPYMATIFKHVLGTLASTGSSPYVHTIKVGNLPAGIVIEKQFPNLATPQYFKYNGCKINSCRMSFKSEGAITTVFNILGAKETVGTSALDASATDYGNVPWEMMEATLTEGGSASTIVTELDILIENNLDGSVFTIGNSGQRKELPVGTVKVSGTLKALFDSVTLYNKAVNNTESSIKVSFSRGDGLGSAGNEFTELLIPELIYTPKSPMITGALGVFTELSYEGYYQNSSEASTFQAIFKNTIATP